MQKLKQGIQSTKFDKEEPKIKTHEVYIKNILINDTKDTVYTNLCGQFPYRALTGNNYVFGPYNYNSNTIIAKPMKNRSDKTPCNSRIPPVQTNSRTLETWHKQYHIHTSGGQFWH